MADSGGRALVLPAAAPVAAAGTARDMAYARIEATLIARAQGGADGQEFDPVLALNLLKLRRTERATGEAATADAVRVPIAVVRDALLKRLAGIARQEGG